MSGKRAAALLLAALMGLAMFLLATTGSRAKGELGESAPRAADSGELARGGDRVLPKYRVVAFAGAPQADALGALGTTGPRKASRRLLRQARPYGKGRRGRKPVYPAFELIATIALSSRGEDGKYRYRQPDRIIRRYAREAERRDFLLLLDIQPGRSTFIEEARHLKKWLRMPNVGLALDPEWNMGRRGVPGERIGSVGAHMVNRVSKLMSELAVKRDLPQKMLVLHQFTEEMIKNERRLRNPRRVGLVLDSTASAARRRSAPSTATSPPARARRTRASSSSTRRIATR